MDVLGCVYRASQVPRTVVTSADPPCDQEIIQFFADRRLMRVTGFLVHSDILGKALSLALPVSTIIEGRQLYIYGKIPKNAFGMAVRSAEDYMIVSNTKNNRVDVFALADSSCTKVASFGTAGSRPGQFVNPYRLCLSAMEDTVLVAEFENNRVQEFGIPHGKFQRQLAVRHAVCVTCSPDGVWIAVGTGRDERTIELLSYESGAAVRQISGFFAEQIEGLRFTLDSKHIAATDSGLYYVCLIAVCDGMLVRQLCNYMMAGNWNDVCFAPTGELFAISSIHHCVRVYDCGGETIVKELGKFSWTSSEQLFVFPTCVCFVNGHLFVLDTYGGCVKVFD